MTTEQLRRIYKAFSPDPLAARDQNLYVELDDVRGSSGMIERLEERLRGSPTSVCRVITGHRGSGKSTELRRLQRRLASGPERLFVVLCEAEKDFNPDTDKVDFPDLLLAMVRQLATQVRDQTELVLGPGYFAQRWESLRNLLGSDVDFDRVDVGNGLLTLSGIIRNSPNARAKVQQALEPDTGNLLVAANDLIGQAKLGLRNKGFSGLAIIVDGLDRLPPAVAEPLFLNRAPQMTAFQCHLIYTIPLDLAYSLAEPRIATLYGGHIPVIPMTKIRTPPPERRPYEAGIQRFRDLIGRRLREAGLAAEDFFASTAACDRLIELSGGQPQQLVFMINDVLDGRQIPVEEAAVDRAVLDGRRAYARQLGSVHWPILRRVARTGRFERTPDTDGVVRELLASRALLQYRNEAEWYDLNPLVSVPPEPPPREPGV